MIVVVAAPPVKRITFEEALVMACVDIFLKRSHAPEFVLALGSVTLVVVLGLNITLGAFIVTVGTLLVTVTGAGVA